MEEEKKKNYRERFERVAAFFFIVCSRNILKIYVHMRAFVSFAVRVDVAYAFFVRVSLWSFISLSAVAKSRKNEGVRKNRGQ